MSLPPATHCYLLPLLSRTLPLYYEIGKHSARFILSCLFTWSSLVRSIAIVWFGCESVIGRNTLLCCKRFDWLFADFTSGKLSLCNTNFGTFHKLRTGITHAQRESGLSLSVLLDLRDQASVLSNGMSLLRSEIDGLISYVCCT